MRAGFDDWNGSHQLGLLSAIACGDRRGEAIMHRNLGQLALYQDDWENARRHFDAAAPVFAEVGDRLGEGVTAVGLGTWLRERGARTSAPGAVREGDRGVRRGRQRERRGAGPDRRRERLPGPRTTGDRRRYLAQAFLIAVRRATPTARPRSGAGSRRSGSTRDGPTRRSGSCARRWRSSTASVTTTARRTPGPSSGGR